MSGNISYLSAREAAEAIRTKRVSSREVVTHALNRIKTLNPVINAVVTLREEQALQEADEADRAVGKGIAVGPLHGVPVTIKDNIAVKGTRCTASHPPLSENVPRYDAVVVGRLREAGAIVLGKTNLPELAMDLQTRSPLFGITNNPWDLNRTPGGSSGGEAAAVAAGMSYLGTGNDLLASVRLPAHYCGVFSLLPTEGLVPLFGFVPEYRPGGLLQRFLRMGFLSRSLEDLAIALEACAGYHESDPYLFPAPLRALKSLRNGDRPRIAWTLGLGTIDADIDTRKAIAGFMGRISASGCRVEELPRVPIDHAKILRVWVNAFGAAVGMKLPPMIRFLAGLRDPSIHMDLSRFFNTEYERVELIRQMESLFSDWDVLITPASATPAFPHMKPAHYQGPMPVYKDGIDVNGKTIDFGAATAGFALPYAITGNPVVTLPVGFSREGLPIGVQAVGKRWHDFELLITLSDLTKGIAAFSPPPRYA
jgi:amidase